jgi:NADH-quinone oxidoreductase subunit F
MPFADANDLIPLRPVLERYAPQGRTALLPALQAAQAIYGHLPEPVSAALATALGVPLADIHGAIDFFSMLYRNPVGERIIRVCGDPSCALAGGDAVLAAASRRLKTSPGETSADGRYLLEESPCLGLCEHAPAALVDEIPLARVAAGDVEGLLSGIGQDPTGIVGGDLRLLTANCGRGQAAPLKEYVSAGGYEGLRKALGMAPPAVVAEVKASGLVGRGGAAFPTGTKWEGAAAAPGTPKYVVCNADESEPGTFKDRVLMEEDPHRTLEGLAIAAYAIRAQHGYIYVRGEYPRAIQRLQAAILEARTAGYLGPDILGSGFSLEVEIRQGAGAYICGEETALFESIEGKRGFPRVKPPFPTTHGLFQKPTVINNVETLCNVPTILTKGAGGYRQLGTEKSPGPKLFCVSGQVQKPGLYEVAFGVTLRHLLFDLAGGLHPGRRLQAVLFGGAAGAFATESHLDVRLSFEDLRAAGLPLGSGVVMVLDDTADLRDVLRRLAKFFAHESCGKCYPCQIGTQRQHEILDRVAAGHPQPGDRERLSDVGWTMTDASLCGLGQTAATAVLSALTLWPDLFEGGRR